MAKHPNIPPISRMFYEWTQPYVNMEGMWDLKDHNKNDLISTSDVLAQQDLLEQELDAMTEYPLALELIMKAKEKK